MKVYNGLNHIFVFLQKISPDMVDDEGFFELLSKFQSRRMDEQRCSIRVNENENLAAENALAAEAAAQSGDAGKGEGQGHLFKVTGLYLTLSEIRYGYGQSL